jgi:hypothetical protein
MIGKYRGPPGHAADGVTFSGLRALVVAPGIGRVENGQGWLSPYRLQTDGQNQKTCPDRNL